jgi:CRP-like cAMP-binding protein
MSSLSNLELLRRVPMFSALTPAQMAQIAGAVTKHRFKRGELIVEQGKKSHALYVILSGTARVVISDRRKKEMILAILGPGDYVGEISLIDGKGHSANVQTQVATDVLVLGYDEFRHCLADNQAIAFAVMKGLAVRLRKADDKIRSLALLDVYGRVAGLLMNQATPLEGNALVIRDKLTRQDIAKMVGASREMVSRVMRDFEEQGFIRVDDNGATHLTERRSTLR